MAEPTMQYDYVKEDRERLVASAIAVLIKSGVVTWKQRDEGNGEVGIGVSGTLELNLRLSRVNDDELWLSVEPKNPDVEMSDEVLGENNGFCFITNCCDGVLVEHLKVFQDVWEKAVFEPFS